MPFFNGFFSFLANSPLGGGGGLVCFYQLSNNVTYQLSLVLFYHILPFLRENFMKKLLMETIDTHLLCCNQDIIQLMKLKVDERENYHVISYG